MMERTFVAIKPDGVQRGLIGRIIERFENAGLKIIGLKMVQIDKDFAKKHYKAHVKKPFYKGLEEFIVDGPVVAMVIEGLHAVEAVRKIVGPTEPKEAAPGTIRGDFAHHSYAWTDKKGIAVKNLIHASADKKDAEEEIKLWFSIEELNDYKTVHEKHVF
jgi:nucleoside-diphosphate kinase